MKRPRQWDRAARSAYRRDRSSEGLSYLDVLRDKAPVGNKVAITVVAGLVLIRRCI